MSGRDAVALASWAVASGVVLGALHLPVSQLAATGVLLDPADGLYYNARHAEHPPAQRLHIPGLDAEVVVERDERGVPHIFATTDRDATMALGYVVAQDRAVQLDFLPRVAAGRLAEIYGAGALEADRFLRQTGMEMGARKLAERLARERGLEYELTTWFAAGANAYLDGLSAAELPFECKLLGYRPDRYTPLHAARLLQYFVYDMTYRHLEPAYSVLRDRLGDAAYELLYPSHSLHYVPMIPEAPRARASGVRMAAATKSREALARLARMKDVLSAWGAPGYHVPKGSNNWAVSAALSGTGFPILAGDMHLELSLPAIWYEAHIVTPELNLYGVLPPGTPVVVEAFNDALGWAYTNTGADVLDHYVLQLDSTGQQYRYGDRWRPLERRPDTLHVKDGPARIDTLLFSHFGPVIPMDTGAVALRWVAHEPGGIMRAIWNMNRAGSLEEFDAALRHFDMPAMNILYADTAGTVSIRSTGKIPIRRAGHGVGLLDGTTDRFEWTGWIPFEELPHAVQPAQGYLFSANQLPVGPGYPHYLGHDWPDAYRALRIDSLLRSRPQHDVEDFLRYQSDVHVVQRDLFVPLLEGLAGLGRDAGAVRDRLLSWNGEASLDSEAPLAMLLFLENLRSLAWDEAVFDDMPLPKDMTLRYLLRRGSDWLDVAATDEKEDASMLLAMALEETAETLGREFPDMRWGSVHHLLLRHLTQTPALSALWSGPHRYPGFDETVAPGSELETTHGASWRVVVDFSRRPPQGYGIYPGGQSGRPLSRYYDHHVASYVAFEHYALHRPRRPGELAEVSSRLTLSP